MIRRLMIALAALWLPGCGDEPIYVGRYGEEEVAKLQYTVRCVDNLTKMTKAQVTNEQGVPYLPVEAVRYCICFGVTERGGYQDMPEICPKQ